MKIIRKKIVVRGVEFEVIDCPDIRKIEQEEREMISKEWNGNDLYE